MADLVLQDASPSAQLDQRNALVHRPASDSEEVLPVSLRPTPIALRDVEGDREAGAGELVR